MDLNIRICGEAGQGVQSMGGLLARTFRMAGLHALATQSYMSRIRGGVNSYDIRISEGEVFSPRVKADLIVAMSAPALETYRDTLAPGGIVVFDGADAGCENNICVAMAEAAKSVGGTMQNANSVAAGMVVALLGYDAETLCRMLKRQYAHKGADVADANAASARKGAELALAHRGRLKAPPAGGKPVGELFSGADAVALSALVSGVKVASCYPMTPSTGIFTALAGMAGLYGAVVEQAEDEICAVNLVCGAVYAGVPAITATSGGGFALMVEGLALAGMLELPLVIVLSQRPGPATSLPTRTGQEDLRFAIFAGHGEFARAVYAPGTIQQAYSLTRRALQTAHKFQTPAIVMTDQFIADMQKIIPRLPAEPDPIDRFVEKNPGPGYERYAVTESGVSPRAVPGGEAFVIVDSDEHTPDGHLTEDLGVRVIMQEKRMRKGAGILAEALAPEVYPLLDTEALLCWGSTFGPCREAVDLLRAKGRPVCMIHFSQVWPLDADKLRDVFTGRKVFAVEGNFSAQFATMLKMAGALDSWETILRYDGLPFTAEEIAERFLK